MENFVLLPREDTQDILGFLFNQTTLLSTECLEKLLHDFTGTISVQCEHPVFFEGKLEPCVQLKQKRTSNRYSGKTEGCRDDVSPKDFVNFTEKINPYDEVVGFCCRTRRWSSSLCQRTAFLTSDYRDHHCIDSIKIQLFTDPLTFW